MKTKRIFWKLYPSYLIITLLSLAAVFFLSSSALRRFYEGQTAESLNVQARFASEQMRGFFGNDQRLRQDGLNAESNDVANVYLYSGNVSPDATHNDRDSNSVEMLARISEVLGGQTSARITVIFPDGLVVGDSEKAPAEMGNHRARPEIREALAGRVGESVRFSNTLKKNMMYVAVPVFRDGEVIGVVRTALPLAEMEQMFDQMQHRIIWGGLAILLLSALFSLVISRRISRPLEQIKQGAERFAAGDFSQRLYAGGSAEISSLTETMNTMADQLEERLSSVVQERNQREAVLSSMVEGVLAVDTKGRIISLNKAAAHFFQGLEPSEAKGRSVEEVFRNVTLQKFIAEVLDAKETCECELHLQNSQVSDLQVRGTNLLGVQGARIGAVVVFNDVSRLRRLENLRREFVANVSHELKTPITSIKGFVETLIDGAMNDPAEADRFLKIVSKHADRLNSIIDDLLTLSRLEQGSLEELEVYPATMAGMIRSAVEICARRAAKKNIEIQIECPDKLTARVNQPLVEQALINLIGNAVKYSANEQPITVHARAEAGETILSVSDQGYGIESEHLDRLFERFYRVDKGRSRQEGGTGLGLAIVKHIAQVHGGRVDVQSIFGQGSVFSIFLPSV